MKCLLLYTPDAERALGAVEKGPGSALEYYRKVIDENEPDFVIFREYQFHVDDVLEDFGSLESSAKATHADILLTPKNDHHGHDGHSWEETVRLLEGKNVTPENAAFGGNYSPDSIAFLVGNDGQSYCFEKSWQKRPLHIVDGRKIGITICGEINHLDRIDPKLLEGLRVILNPSAEGDDVWLRGYNMVKSGCPEDELCAAYMWMTRTPQDKEKFLKKAGEESFYIKYYVPVLEEYGLPVVRCDTFNCSGMLYLPENFSLKSYNANQSQGYTLLDFESEPDE